jgi:hypothetical protein
VYNGLGEPLHFLDPDRAEVNASEGQNESTLERTGLPIRLRYSDTFFRVLSTRKWLMPP